MRDARIHPAVSLIQNAIAPASQMSTIHVVALLLDEVAVIAGMGANQASPVWATGVINAASALQARR